MLNSPQHKMQLEITHPTGAEEWACPECGRRILMQWPPNYKRIVLEAGDELALHNGSKGGLSLGISQVKPDDELAAQALKDDLWAEWLEDLDFGNSEDDAGPDSEAPE